MLTELIMTGVLLLSIHPAALPVARSIPVNDMTGQTIVLSKPYDVDREITTSIEASRSFYPSNQYIKVYYKNNTGKEARIFIQDSNGQNIIQPLIVEANGQDSFILTLKS